MKLSCFLSKYDPDPLRLYLTTTAHETRHAEFSWEDFVERNNNELVATRDNLYQRPRRALGPILSFAYKRFATWASAAGTGAALQEAR